MDISARFAIMSTKVRVGAVQSEPVWLNLEGSVDKTIALIRQSAKEGIQVLGFPEVWIPGYPWYVAPSCE
jgi:nitrilase